MSIDPDDGTYDSARWLRSPFVVTWYSLISSTDVDEATGDVFAAGHRSDVDARTQLTPGFLGRYASADGSLVSTKLYPRLNRVHRIVHDSNASLLFFSSELSGF